MYWSDAEGAEPPSAGASDSSEGHPLDAVVQRRHGGTQPPRDAGRRDRSVSPDPHGSRRAAPPRRRPDTGSDSDAGRGSSGSDGSPESGELPRGAADASAEPGETSSDGEGRSGSPAGSSADGSGRGAPPSACGKEGVEEEESAGPAAGDEAGSDSGSDSGPASAGGAALEARPPVGVMVIAEGEERRNAQVAKLLRMPRYFDEDFDEGGKRCFRCGGKGHMARDCTAAAAILRPCFLCAQHGHESRDCPNSLCWRCHCPGHMARDCPNARGGAGGQSTWDDAAAPGPPLCLRCGRADCAAAGQRDYVRAEGGCTGNYLPTDLRHVRCLSCRQRGHLCCARAPDRPAQLSCHNCGEAGHSAEDCRRETPAVVRGERSGAGGARSAGYDRYESGGRYDGYGRSQSGGARYDSGSQYGRQYGSEGRYGRYDEAARYDAQQYGRQQSWRYSEAGGGGGGGAAKRARLSYGELANEGGGGGGYQRGRNRR